MSTQRTINVPLETYHRIRAVHDRLSVMPVEKMTDQLRTLLARGISLSSVTGLAVELLEKEVDRMEGPALAEIVVEPPRRKKKVPTDV